VGDKGIEEWKNKGELNVLMLRKGGENCERDK
jgi:hypothetical protein